MFKVFSITVNPCQKQITRFGDSGKKNGKVPRKRDAKI